ncbi:unnamed protein product [Phytomonas sp. EM1]|nr:unnamed protein product [Phytomonas sp. EM1]|eukprot:CCW63567.1 unnamed protein product [Phytomonas sp. isolate EM1]
MLQKQRANRILRGMLREAAAEQASEEVMRTFELAAMAHRVIRRWFIDLAPFLTPASEMKRFARQGGNLASSPSATTTTPAETMQAALVWFQETFHSPDPDEKKGRY